MILLPHYVNFLIEHDLTQEQVLFLELIYRKEKGLIQKYKKHFPNNTDSMISPYLIGKLLDKEFLIKTETGYKLGKKYLDIYVTPDVAVDEIFDIYPTFIKTEQGVEMPLTAMDKKVFREIYIPKIMGNLQEHREVLLDIQYGIENDLIKMGIQKFLTSEYWKALRKRRIEQLQVDISTNNFDEDF